MFAHLHVHSNYSFCRGASSIEALVRGACERGMRSMALTDTNGLYGLIWFLQAAAENGLLPIVGVEIRTQQERAVVLARDRDGYATLCRITSRRQLEPGFSLASSLLGERERLIVISDDTNLLEVLVKQNGSSGIFVELNDPAAEPRLTAFARARGVECVATNDVHFLDPADLKPLAWRGKDSVTTPRPVTTDGDGWCEVEAPQRGYVVYGV